MSEEAAKVRATLTRERVLATALELADSEGLEALSMRRLGHALGVEAMSLYNHVANKADLIDSMIEQLLIELNDAVRDQPPGDTWRETLRARILTARATMLAHKWVPAALETRTAISVPIMMWFDGIIAILRAGGFSNDLTHHSMHALGSKALGFSQELFDPASPGDATMTPAAMVALAQQAPHLAAMLADITHDPADQTIGFCDDQTEFEFGLDVLLEGLQARLDAESARSRG